MEVDKLYLFYKSKTSLSFCLRERWRLGDLLEVWNALVNAECRRKFQLPDFQTAGENVDVEYRFKKDFDMPKG